MNFSFLKSNITGTRIFILFLLSSCGLSGGNAPGLDACTLNPSWTPSYSNIQFHYDFNGELGTIPNGTEINPTVGTSMTVVDGNSDGTISFVSGLSSNAISSNENNDHLIQTTNDTNLNITGDISISFWLNLDKLPSSAALVLEKNDVTNSFMPYQVFIDSSGRVVFTHGGGSLEELTSTDSISAGSWYHILVVRDTASTNISYYFNGSEDSGGKVNYSSSISGTSSQAVFLGRPVGDFSVPGKTDELAIWNTKLTSGNARSIYDRQSSCL